MAKDDSEDKSVQDALAALGASGVGAALIIVLGAGAPGAALLGLAPGSLLTVRSVARRVVEQSERSAARVVERAAEICDVGLDVFEQRTAAYDDRVALIGRVLTAAGTTAYDEKIEALAKALALGIRDDDGATAEASVLVAALADLERPHVDLLDFLAATPIPPDELRAQTAIEPRGWEVGELIRARQAFVVADALVMILSGHGLIADQGGVTYPGAVGPAVYRVTPLGLRFLVLFNRRYE